MTNTPNRNNNPLYDKAAVIEAMRLLVGERRVTELRVLGTVTNADRRPHTLSGYFDDPVKLAEALAGAGILSAKGMYFTPNAVEAALLARAANRVRKAESGDTTTDGHVTRRHWLPIDADAKRPSGISANEQEHAAALAKVQAIRAHLGALGWPDPFAGDSGNGGHLLYAIDLPADDGALVQRCLLALAKRFDDETVQIDKGVYNPARIWKLYGTRACKGDNTPDRPWRMARILSRPDQLAAVPTELLEALAAEAADEASAAARPANAIAPHTARGAPFDVAAFIQRHNLDVTGPKEWQGGQLWVFRTSPMCEHHDGAAYLAQQASGAPVAGCHHNSCKDKWGWTDLRQKYEPAELRRRNPEEGPRPSVADQLVSLALAGFRFGQTPKHEPFAVPHKGANIALLLKGGSDALRPTLARAYRAQNGRTPGASALADALNLLTGEALAAEAEPVHLRIARDGSTIVMDLGDADGRAVVVREGTWEVVARAPLLFRRTPLTAAMPLPERGGSLDELRDLLNVTADTWPLVLGWLVAALVPDIPHPIVLLTGLQGTGKSCAARVLLRLIDDSPAPLRAEPRHLDDWQVAAAGSWAVALDNISGIAPWFADALCRAATGDGLVKRALFTDSGLTVLSFRRVIMLTSIDAGALRGDLGERLLLVDLEPIDEVARRTEAELDAAFAERRPRLFGALLDATAAALAKLPDVRLERLPRMADFARVLAACDAAGVTDGALPRYLAQGQRVAQEVTDHDPFAVAVMELVTQRGEWSGTAGELLGAVLRDPDKLPRGWPAPNRVAGRLRRLIPAMAAQGIGVTIPQGRSRRGRIIRLESRPPASTPPSHWPKSTVMGGDEPGDSQPVGDAPPTPTVTPRPRGNAEKTAPGDDGDGGDTPLSNGTPPFVSSDDAWGEL